MCIRDRVYAIQRMHFHAGHAPCVQKARTQLQNHGLQFLCQSGSLFRTSATQSVAEDVYKRQVMCYPDVLAARQTVLEKLALAADAGKRADGHAPGLSCLLYTSRCV